MNNYSDKRTYFILTEFRVELYFAVIPDEKTRQGLAVCGWRWNGRSRCWYNRKTEENIRMAESLCREHDVQPNSCDALPKYKVAFGDVVLRCNSFYCNLHHEVEDVAGIISFIDKRGEWRTKTIPLALCHKCNTYYILEETYNSIKKWGIMGCRIMKKSDYDKYGHLDLNSEEWREQSPLKMWGYSVSKIDGLTDEQRRQILVELIKNNIMTKDRILSYLDFFCKLSTHEDSIDCWKRDREYLANYRNEGRKVSITY